MTEKAHILISGRDYELLRTRGLVLETAGFRVSTTIKPLRTIDASVDLLIVCHTLSAAERQHDVSTLASALPDARALCLMPHTGHLVDGAVTLDSFCGPQKMLNVVERLLTA